MHGSSEIRSHVAVGPEGTQQVSQSPTRFSVVQNISRLLWVRPWVSSGPLGHRAEPDRARQQRPRQASGTVKVHENIKMVHVMHVHYVGDCWRLLEIVGDCWQPSSDPSLSLPLAMRHTCDEAWRHGGMAQV